MSGKLIIPNKSIRISNDSFNTSISNDSLDVHNFIWSTSALDWVRCTTSTSGEPVVSVSNFPSSYAVTGSVKWVFTQNKFDEIFDTAVSNVIEGVKNESAKVV